MPDLADIIAAMPDAQREGALIVLDALTRPLTPREIDAALMRNCGLTRSRAFLMTKAIKGLAIVAMVGPEHG